MQLTDWVSAKNALLLLDAKLTACGRALQGFGVKLVQSYCPDARVPDRNREEAATRNQTLAEVIDTLERLNQNTEQDFLAIGGSLVAFMASAARISTALTELTEVASGDQVARASEALTCALSKFKEFEARNINQRSRMRSLRKGAVQLKQTLSDFDGTAQVFQTLGILTRIEAVRLQGDGDNFSHLPDDLKQMAENVRLRVSGALEKAADLIAPIEDVAREIADREAGRARDLPAAIAAARAGLDTFLQSQKEARDCSIRLGAQYREIAAAFGSLIVSVQSHDLTRQKIEHVISVLRRVQCGTEGEERLSSRGAVIALQSAQLAHAEVEFALSVANIAESLGTIATRVMTMTGESRALDGLSGDGTPSLLERMETGCLALLTCLAESTGAEKLTRDTSKRLAENIERMWESIADIETVEIQMRLLAINACIRASQIGEAGNTLDALSMFMQQRADEARSRSEALVEVLTSMSDTSKRLAGFDESSPTSEPEQGNNCLALLGDAVANLHATTERTATQIPQLVADGNELREHVAAARDGFSVGDVFAETLQRTQCLLEELAGTDFAGQSGEAQAELAEHLAAFATHYTMQSEYDVYEKFAQRSLGVTLGPVTQHQEGVPAGGAGAAGEIDVEFF